MNKKLKCSECGWEGKASELKCKYFANPQEFGDVIPEPVCPVCESESLE